MSVALSYGEQGTRHEQTSRRTHKYSVVSASSAGQGCLRDAEPITSSTSQRNISHQHHHSRICQEGICSMGIEHEIIRHPDSMTCFDAVSLCLRLDVVFLQSIRTLREAGPWHDQLESIYSPLFTSPPVDLFNMILALRNFPQFEPARIIKQLEERRDNASKARKPEASRTAPDGQAYACPSENCKKQFKKFGHAQNHVENKHPEYLMLHPDYQPPQFIVEALRSVSGSPELQRTHERQPAPRRSAPGQRPDSDPSAGLSLSLLEPMEQSLLHSPRSFGFSSLNDWDEQPNLSRSRSHSRPSPQQPVTPQPHETGMTGADRHFAVNAMAPYLGSPQAKRGRDLYSSAESIAAKYDVGERAATTRPGRRQSKRLSTHVSNW